GKRVKKVTDQETTVFVYSSGKLIAEYSTQVSSQPHTDYTTTDHLGSPRIITDELGQVTARRDFMPFGEDIFVNVGNRTTALKYGTNTDDLRQKFTGYQKDTETSLDFAEARMYANSLGRFTAVDPLLASGKSANPQTFNRYAYVGGNPISRSDKNGQDWYDEVGTRVTYGRTYTTHNPVWHDGVVFGGTPWKRGDVFRVTGGPNRGKYATLDSFSDHWTLSSTRAGAVAARDGYRRQAVADVAGGTLQPVVDLANAAQTVAQAGMNPAMSNLNPSIAQTLSDKLFNIFGLHPNSSSELFRTQARFTSALITVGTAFGGEAAEASSALGSGITNPVPSRLARVIPGEGPFPTLGLPGDSRVFVTAADDIAGLNASQLGPRLGIQDSNVFTTIEFDTPTTGIASPFTSNKPGFVGFGRTSGGAREFTIPNGSIPCGAVFRRVC
ncbi:MAG: polymorphic toxin type 10 domain-containing protein, partial [Acidobacteriota bacterium]